MSAISLFFFFNDTATTEIYTLSLHDALPISPSTNPRSDGQPGGSHCRAGSAPLRARTIRDGRSERSPDRIVRARRSEEHTSELQSLRHLVCRLLLDKKKRS